MKQRYLNRQSHSFWVHLARQRSSLPAGFWEEKCFRPRTCKCGSERSAGTYARDFQISSLRYWYRTISQDRLQSLWDQVRLRFGSRMGQPGLVCHCWKVLGCQQHVSGGRSAFQNYCRQFVVSIASMREGHSRGASIDNGPCTPTNYQSWGCRRVCRARSRSRSAAAWTIYSKLSRWAPWSGPRNPRHCAGRTSLRKYKPRSARGTLQSLNYISGCPYWRLSQ